MESRRISWWCYIHFVFLPDPAVWKMTVASTMHGGNIPRLPSGMARAAVQLYRSSSLMGPGLVPIDGCVLLGKDETTATCEYATRYFINDREAQRQLVVHQVLLSNLVPCCAPHDGCGCKERIWGFISSELTLLTLHLACLIIGFLKIFVHTLETHHDIHLMHAVLETVITCTIVIIRAFATRSKFHDIKETRLKFEYMSDGALARSKGLKVWTCVYFLASLLLCALVVGFFVICFLYSHLGWITVTHQAVIIITAFMAKLTMSRYDLMIARIEHDQHTMVLLEGATLLVEQMCAVSTTQKEDVNSRVGHYLRGLNRSTAFDRPPYISYMDEHDEDNVLNETGIWAQWLGNYVMDVNNGTCTITTKSNCNAKRRSSRNANNSVDKRCRSASLTWKYVLLIRKQVTWWPFTELPICYPIVERAGICYNLLPPSSKGQELTWKSTIYGSKWNWTSGSLSLEEIVHWFLRFCSNDW